MYNVKIIRKKKWVRNEYRPRYDDVTGEWEEVIIHGHYEYDPNPTTINIQLITRYDLTRPYKLSLYTYTSSGKVGIMLHGKKDADQALAYVNDSELVDMAKQIVKESCLTAVGALIDNLTERNHWIAKPLQMWWEDATKVNNPPVPPVKKPTFSMFD